VESEVTATILFGSGELSGIFGSDDVRVGFGGSEIHVLNTTLGLIIQDAVTTS
jgi:hypothetical protein